jgi:hypothetical protein
MTLTFGTLTLLSYEFPLDPKASICDFYAEIDDKKVVGQIKEKEAAKDTYDDAIASGHGAYMLEQNEVTKNFTASIGNLPPGKEVSIVIVYVTELEFDESGKLKLVLPATPYPPDGVNSKRLVTFWIRISDKTDSDTVSSNNCDVLILRQSFWNSLSVLKRLRTSGQYHWLYEYIAC